MQPSAAAFPTPAFCLKSFARLSLMHFPFPLTVFPVRSVLLLFLLLSFLSPHNHFLSVSYLYLLLRCLLHFALSVMPSWTGVLKSHSFLITFSSVLKTIRKLISNLSWLFGTDQAVPPSPSITSVCSLLRWDEDYLMFSGQRYFHLHTLCRPPSRGHPKHSRLSCLFASFSAVSWFLSALGPECLHFCSFPGPTEFYDLFFCKRLLRSHAPHRQPRWLQPGSRMHAAVPSLPSSVRYSNCHFQFPPLCLYGQRNSPLQPPAFFA